MNEQTQHVSKVFDEELSTLRSHVLEMGGLVEAQMLAAVKSYYSGEIGEVQSIVESDRKVNNFEKLIDDECAQVVAKRQPAAFDLRLVLGVSKIVTDLERIGDESKKIAKGARRIYERGQMPLPRTADVRHMADISVGMLRRALDAFARLDVSEARQVILADADVDVEFKAIMRQLITYMMEDPRTITCAIDIIWIARAVERIGDHAKNVAEHVFYIIEGQDIRHQKKEARS